MPDVAAAEVVAPGERGRCARRYWDRRRQPTRPRRPSRSTGSCRFPAGRSRDIPAICRMPSGAGFRQGSPRLAGRARVFPRWRHRWPSPPRGARARSGRSSGWGAARRHPEPPPFRSRCSVRPRPPDCPHGLPPAAPGCGTAPREQTRHTASSRPGSSGARRRATASASPVHRRACAMCPPRHRAPTAAAGRRRPRRTRSPCRPGTTPAASTRPPGIPRRCVSWPSPCIGSPPQPSNSACRRAGSARPGWPWCRREEPAPRTRRSARPPKRRTACPRGKPPSRRRGRREEPRGDRQAESAGELRWPRSAKPLRPRTQGRTMAFIGVLMLMESLLPTAVKRAGEPARR